MKKIQSLILDQLDDATALESNNGMIEFELEEGFGRYEILKRWVYFGAPTPDANIPECADYTALENGLQFHGWSDLFDVKRNPLEDDATDYIVRQNPEPLKKVENNHPLDFAQIIATGNGNRAGFEYKYDKLPNAVTSRWSEVDLTGQKIVLTLISSMVKDRDALCEIFDCEYYFRYNSQSGGNIPYQVLQDQALGLGGGPLLRNPGRNHSKYIDDRAGYFGAERFLSECAVRPTYNISGCPLSVRASYDPGVTKLSTGTNIELVIE